MVAPDRLIVFDPGMAVMTPLPHPPNSPLGVATTSPAGNVSLKLVTRESPAVPCSRPQEDHKTAIPTLNA